MMYSTKLFTNAIAFTLTLLFLLYSCTTAWCQKGNGDERRMGIGLDYAFATKGVTPSFTISTGGVSINNSTVYANLFFKFAAGPETGYYSGNTNTYEAQLYLTSIMRGDNLISYEYRGLTSGFTGSIAIIPTLIIPTKVVEKDKTKYIKNWFYLGVGLQVSNHPKTLGSYTVVSRDSQYEYTDREEYEFHPRFFDLSPTIIIYGTSFGFSYSMQSVFDKSKINHTLGFTYLMPF